MLLCWSAKRDTSHALIWAGHVCRCQEAEPTGAGGQPLRFAVKCYHSASETLIREEERTVMKMSGKPGTVKHHGLFWNPEPPSPDCGKHRAYLVMGCAFFDQNHLPAAQD